MSWRTRASMPARSPEPEGTLGEIALYCTGTVGCGPEPPLDGGRPLRLRGLQ